MKRVYNISDELLAGYYYEFTSKIMNKPYEMAFSNFKEILILLFEELSEYSHEAETNEESYLSVIEEVIDRQLNFLIGNLDIDINNFRRDKDVNCFYSTICRAKNFWHETNDVYPWNLYVRKDVPERIENRVNKKLEKTIKLATEHMIKAMSLKIAELKEKKVSNKSSLIKIINELNDHLTMCREYGIELVSFEKDVLDIINRLIGYRADQHIKKAQVIHAGGNQKRYNSLLAEANVIYNQDVREFGQNFQLENFEEFLERYN